MLLTIGSIMNFKKYLLTTVLLLTCFLGFANNETEPQTKTADEQKADYLLLFTQYADWNNEDETNRLVIGILGESPVEKYLQDLVQAKTIRNKAVMVQRYSSVDEITNPVVQTPGNFCHILFIPSDCKSVSSEQMIALAQNNTMVIGEQKGFLNEGGFINLVMQARNQLKFEINPHAMKYGFKISPKILKIAILVDDVEPSVPVGAGLEAGNGSTP